MEMFSKPYSESEMVLMRVSGFWRRSWDVILVTVLSRRYLKADANRESHRGMIGTCLSISEWCLFSDKNVFFYE